jgi:ankyrin repeat protein
MAYEAGADINIKNNLNLTPLTLAAKLAKTEIFFHILNIQREIYWQIGLIKFCVLTSQQLRDLFQEVSRARPIPWH